MVVRRKKGEAGRGRKVEDRSREGGLTALKFIGFAKSCELSAGSRDTEFI